MSRKTGSDEDSPICLVDGETAKEKYGVPIKTGGPCPGCGAAVELILKFNPLDSYYYFGPCPVCLGVYRYLNPEGKLDDLQEVVGRKTTAFDEDEDFPFGWTF